MENASANSIITGPDSAVQATHRGGGSTRTMPSPDVKGRGVLAIEQKARAEENSPCPFGS
jgi:hypothetical protein